MLYTAGALERGNRRQLILILMQVDARFHPRFMIALVAPDFMNK